MSETPFQPLDAGLQSPELKTDQLYVTEEICDHWRTTSQWAQNTAVLGYLIFGGVVAMLFYIAKTSSSMPPMVFLFALVFTMIVFSISKNLYRYSTRIRQTADESEWEGMETAFSSLKNAYLIYSFCILLIAIIIVLYLGYYVLKVYPLISNTF